MSDGVTSFLQWPIELYGGLLSNHQDNKLPAWIAEEFAKTGRTVTRLGDFNSDGNLAGQENTSKVELSQVWLFLVVLTESCVANP